MRRASQSGLGAVLGSGTSVARSRARCVGSACLMLVTISFLGMSPKNFIAELCAASSLPVRARAFLVLATVLAEASCSPFKTRGVPGSAFWVGDWPLSGRIPVLGDVTLPRADPAARALGGERPVSTRLYRSSPLVLGWMVSDSRPRRKGGRWLPVRLDLRPPRASPGPTQPRPVVLLPTVRRFACRARCLVSNPSHLLSDAGCLEPDAGRLASRLRPLSRP